MKDWKSYRASYSFTELYEPATLISNGVVDDLPDRFRARFPKLSSLLSTARHTKLDTSSGIRSVFAWTRSDGSVCGWVCFEPTTPSQMTLHPDHRLLLQSFGGIDECWNEPRGLLNNLPSAFWPVTDGAHNNRWVIHGLSPHQYMTFATEVNGNSHVYNIRSGEVRFLDRIDGVHKIEDVPDFQAWVERIAQEWLDHIDGKQTAYPKYHQ